MSQVKKLSLINPELLNDDGEWAIENEPSILPVRERNKIEYLNTMSNIFGRHKWSVRKFMEYQDKIGDGKFMFISDVFERENLVNAWLAITFTNNWDFVAQDISSFVFSDDSRIDIIFREMEELGNTGHSGSSFACTMRKMQYLVKNGIERFKKHLNIENIVDYDHV